jgi:hypothetical protein
LTEEETSGDKLLYDIVIERYNQEWDRTNDLDSKANNAITFSGLLSTLSAAFAQFSILETHAYLLLIPTAIFISSAIVGLMAHWTEKFTTIDPRLLIQKYGDKTRDEILRMFTSTVSEITMSNQEKNQSKAQFVSLALSLLVIAIFVLLIISVLSLWL